MSFKVAIIGAGNIGGKRAISINKFHYSKVVVVVDVDYEKAKKLSRELQAETESDWKKVLKRKDIDIVVVSCINKYLAPISITALGERKHVLCEKPLGRNCEESKKIIEAAQRNRVRLKTGFNHRHLPAIVKAKQLLDNGKIGKLCFMRCRYGHGGRPGYEKEWRANKELCGGGELLDQGVHVIDLFRWFAGDFDEAFGYIHTCFWNMKVEDNAFAMLKNKSGIIASMHTSWTQWKNLFSFEIFGTDGYLTIDGLGGNYGVETLKIGKRKPEGGPPKEEIIKFSDGDVSWETEWREFISAIKENREPNGNGWDGYQANKIIEAIYKSVRVGESVRIIGKER